MFGYKTIWHGSICIKFQYVLALCDVLLKLNKLIAIIIDQKFSHILFFLLYEDNFHTQFIDLP